MEKFKKWLCTKKGNYTYIAVTIILGMVCLTICAVYSPIIGILLAIALGIITSYVSNRII